ILEVTANVAAATWWLWLLGAGFEDIALDPTLHSLWVDGNALPLLGAALLLMVPLAVLPGRAGIARVCLVGVATLVTLVVVAPAADESSNVIGVTALVALIAWTGAARVLPREWRLVAAGPLGLAALPAVGLCVILFTIAALRLGTVGQPFEHGVGVRLAEPDTVINPLLLVPLVVALLLAVWVLLPEFPVPILGLPLVVLAAFGTLVSYAVPLALPVAILALLAVVVATPVTHWGKDAGAATLSALAVACALPSAGLVAATCAVAIAVAVLLLRSATPLVGGAMLPAATAGLIWSGAEAADMAVDLRAVPILLVLGLLAIAMPRVEVEATAAVAGLLAAGASLADASDPSTALAIQLTLAGTLAIVSSLVHQDRRVLAWPGAALLVAAMFVPTAAVGATLLAGAVGVALAVLLLRSSDTRTTSLGGLLLPPASAALVWSGTEVANVAADQRAVPVLVVLGLLAIAMPRGEVEATAALAGLLAALASLDIAADQLTALAVDLTVAGALVTMSSLMHEDRRLLAWPGGAMLAAATWVRLYDLGVEAPEAYTLPSAVALIMVGIHRLWRTPGASTAALIPGLTLATVPSLLWVLVEPASGRAILLGLACLGLILVGTRFGWSAPLAVGSIVGGLLVIREVAPYTSELPQWVLIGLAGTILTVVGVTWESRLMELRRATAYLGRLR
ncbi:MAG TPA: hypothetical protein VFU85_10980, partial [Nocardioides sp.]|nr:hypothetical protein [Nocardioides sp.]